MPLDSSGRQAISARLRPPSAISTRAPQICDGVISATGLWLADSDGGGAMAVTRISRSRHWVVRAAGVTTRTRYAADKVCLLVMIGVRADGTKDWSHSPTGSASRRSHGLICCGRAAAAG